MEPSAAATVKIHINSLMAEGDSEPASSEFLIRPRAIHLPHIVLQAYKHN